MKYQFHQFCLISFLILISLSNLLLAQSGGSALSFDGLDDYVQVPDGPSLDLTDGFTIAAWVYLEEYNEWASIVTKGGSDNGSGALAPNNYTIHQTNDGRLRFTSEAATLPYPFPESNTPIALNEWHFVAVTFDGSAILFYLDGAQDGMVAMDGPLPPNNDPLNIGADFPGDDEYWDGMIDELRIWNQPLKKALIRAAMSGHASPKASALVGYWRFDEGAGTIAGDQSRENNDGELKNDPTWVSSGAFSSNFGKNNDDQLTRSGFDKIMLISNYPNPFNPETQIHFQIQESNRVVLKVFNTLGREVRTLADAQFETGYHSICWDGKDNSGNDVASGLYLYRIQAGKFSQAKTMFLLR